MYFQQIQHHWNEIHLFRKAIFHKCYIYLFRRNAHVSNECCITWKATPLFIDGLFSSIRDFLQEQNACPAKSCYNIWKEYDFISSEIACVSKMPCILQVFVCNPLLPARSIVFYQVGMRFCMFTLKETTNTTSLKWIVIFPRKVTCFNCFSGMLTIETKCIFCLSNAAPFEWECLFDKHAPVNQFFSRGERCSFHHPFKKSMFSLIFSGLRKAPNVETFSWELNQSNLLKGQSRWMHFQRNAFRMQFSSI